MYVIQFFLLFPPDIQCPPKNHVVLIDVLFSQRAPGQEATLIWRLACFKICKLGVRWFFWQVTLQQKSKIIFPTQVCSFITFLEKFFFTYKNVCLKLSAFWSHELNFPRWPWFLTLWCRIASWNNSRCQALHVMGGDSLSLSFHMDTVVPAKQSNNDNNLPGV